MLRAYRPIMLLALLVPCWVIAIKYNIDLTVLHNAAELTHTDLSRIYAYNGSLGRYFYGPFSLVLISPLGAISYDAAKFIWIVLQTASFFLLWISLYRLYPKLKETNFHWGWWIVFIFSINPIHNNFQSNNIQLMLAAALFWAELYSRAPEKVETASRRRPRRILRSYQSIPIFCWSALSRYQISLCSKWISLGLSFLSNRTNDCLRPHGHGKAVLGFLSRTLYL